MFPMYAQVYQLLFFFNGLRGLPYPRLPRRSHPYPTIPLLLAGYLWGYP
jgi:hypothetical protein